LFVIKILQQLFYHDISNLMFGQLLSLKDLSKTRETLPQVVLPITISQCSEHIEHNDNTCKSLSRSKKRFANGQISLHLKKTIKYIISREDEKMCCERKLL